MVDINNQQNISITGKNIRISDIVNEVNLSSSNSSNEEDNVPSPKIQYPNKNNSLLKRIKTTLIRCEPFSTDQDLKNIFLDSRISAWRSKLRESTNANMRVDNVISLLYDQFTNTHRSALVMFLEILSERTDTGDICKMLFLDIAKELNNSFRYSEDSIQ